MKLNKQLLIKNAIREIRNLRKYAHPEELHRLILARFDPETIQDCIYGQMTGDCYSERASEIIGRCAVGKFYDDVAKPEAYALAEERQDRLDPQCSVNNKRLAYTALEVLIYQLEKNRRKGVNRDILRYMKGDISNLPHIDWKE